MAMFLDHFYNESIKCPTCGMYVNAEEMDTHFVSHPPGLHWSLTMSPLSSPSSPTGQILFDSIPQPHCPICNKRMKVKENISQKVQLVSHIRIHILVNCILCSSKIKLDDIGDHLTMCRVSHNAFVSCPICNRMFPRTVLTAKKHLQQHISDFICPFPDCSSSIKLIKFDEHMRMHLKTDNDKFQSPSQDKPDYSEDVEHGHSFFCPICGVQIVHDVFSNISRNKRKFVNHMKRHVQVLCSLCSATIEFNYFGTHTSTCRFSNGAASVCTICFSPLAEIKPSRHFREHVPHFCCPFPHCPMLLKYDMVRNHMKTHFDKIIIINPTPANIYTPQFDAPTQCRGPTTTMSDQHNCLYPVGIGSPISDFICPFCDTKHSGNINLISSHLLSCVTIPSDLQIVALPNLIGLRLN